MSETVNRTLSLDERGQWYDTASADLRKAARQYAAHKGWPSGAWSVSPLPPTSTPLGKASLPVAFRRFRQVPQAGCPQGVRVEIPATAEGFIVPPAD